MQFSSWKCCVVWNLQFFFLGYLCRFIFLVASSLISCERDVFVSVKSECQIFYCCYESMIIRESGAEFWYNPWNIRGISFMLFCLFNITFLRGLCQESTYILESTRKLIHDVFEFWNFNSLMALLFGLISLYCRGIYHRPLAYFWTSNMQTQDRIGGLNLLFACQFNKLANPRWQFHL